MRDLPLSEFFRQLSSKAPVPGGGGASALLGAAGASLCAMVANLTRDKKKYAAYREDMERLLRQAEAARDGYLGLMESDAEAFAPLAAAYALPKGAPCRAETLEAALQKACSAPLEILRHTDAAAGMLEELAGKGSRLVLSDVGVAATACGSAAEGAALNVHCNTRLMKDRQFADRADAEAMALLTGIRRRCRAVYERVYQEMRTMPSEVRTMP